MENLLREFPYSQGNLKACHQIQGRRLINYICFLSQEPNGMELAFYIRQRDTQSLWLMSMLFLLN